LRVAVTGPIVAAMKIRGSLINVAIAAVALGGASAASATTTVSGQFTCNNDGVVRPLVGARVQVASPGFLVNPVHGTGYTDSTGTFRITIRPESGSIYLNVALVNSRAFLKDFFGSNEWRINVNSGGRNWQLRRGVPVNTGSYQLPDVKCAVWQGVSNAVGEARSIGAPLPPIGQVTVQADSPLAVSTPFTPYVQIHWRGGVPAGRSAGDHTVAKHEFGHVIRHGFDGNEGEFLLDVARFGYMRNHWECLRTEPGYAFNEGWASYWARDYGSSDCPGTSPADESIEGNVARELARLEVACGMNRARMAQILRDNPGRIHRLSEFAVNVPACAPLTVASAPAIAPEPPPAPDTTATRARTDIVAINARNRTLARQLAGATRIANRTDCRVRTCGVPQLLRLIRPAEIRAEIASNIVLRSNLQRVDTPAELAKVRTISIPAAVRWQRTVERSTRVRVAKAHADATAAALKAAAPVFQRNRSAAVTRIRRQMVARLAQLRRAQRSGAVPPNVTLQLPRDMVAKRVSSRPIVFTPEAPVPDRVPTVVPPPAPAPTPTPTPTPTPPPPSEPPPPAKTTSAMAFTTCPSVGKTQGFHYVAGTLTPASAGSSVTVTYTPPTGAGSTSETLSTDAAGAFSTSFQPGATGGVWTITATFGGDATRTASTATCTVTVT